MRRDGAEHRAPEHRNLAEVIDVSRLKRSVLPIVCEAEDFARFGFYRRLLPEPCDDSARQDRGRGRARCLRKRRELPELSRALVVYAAASKTNQQRPRLKPSFDVMRSEEHTSELQ